MGGGNTRGERALGPLHAKALDLQERSGGTDLSPRLVDFLEFQDPIQILNANRELLPSEWRDLIRELTPRIEQLAPIRNRVMHGRPLLADDPDNAIALSRAILLTQVTLPNLAAVTARLASEPDWSPLLIQRQYAEKVLHNLPLPDFDDTGLIGRGREARDLLQLLLAGRSDVVTVVGEGGIGKTALTVKVLYDLIDHPDCPFDAVLWTSLKTERLTAEGIERLSSAADSLGIANRLAEPLDVNFTGELETLGNQLEGLKALVVVDNTESVDANEIVAVYDAMPSGTRFLFTSRIGLGQLERRFPLGPLAEGDGARLFRLFARRRAIEHLARLPDEQVATIVTSYRNSPLGLKWYVLAVEAGAEPATALHDQEDLLNFCVRSVYESLPSDSQRILRALHLARRPLSFGEIGVLTNTPADDVRQALHNLQRTAFLELTPVPGDVPSQAYEVSDTVDRYLADVDPPSEVERRTYAAGADALRRSEEQRQRDALRRRLGPNTVQVRTSNDAPVAHLLRQALAASHERDLPKAHQLIQRSRDLSPDYFEVPRVAAFIESTSGAVETATALYERAYSIAEPEFKPFVAYYFAGHLARSAYDPERALGLAEEANDALGAPETGLQLGRVLMYLGEFDRALSLFDHVHESSSGLVRLIALTNAVALLRRRAEHIYTEEHLPIAAAQSAADGFRRGCEAMDAGVRDFKLSGTTLACVSEFYRICAAAGNLEQLRPEFEFAEHALARYGPDWLRDNDWGYTVSHLRRLVERADLPPEIFEILQRSSIHAEQAASTAEDRVVAGSIGNLQADRGFGFIKRSDGLPDLYFEPRSATSRSDLIAFVPRMPVVFRVGRNARGLVAVDVKLDGNETTRAVALENRFGSVTQVLEGYGFLRDDATGLTVFVHRNALGKPSDWGRVRTGIRVGYSIELTDRAPRVRQGSGRILDDA